MRARAGGAQAAANKTVRARPSLAALEPAAAAGYGAQVSRLLLFSESNFPLLLVSVPLRGPRGGIMGGFVGGCSSSIVILSKPWSNRQQWPARSTAGRYQQQGHCFDSNQAAAREGAPAADGAKDCRPSLRWTDGLWTDGLQL